MRVYGILTLVMALLQRVAIDKGGQVLVWTGEGWPAATPDVVQSTPIEAAVTLPPPAQILTPQATLTATPADPP